MAPPPATHQFAEHTGELRLRLRADSLGDLLAEGGRALAELALRNGSEGAPGPWTELEVRAADREALLVDWLNELIWRAEAHAAVPIDFEVLSASDDRIRARVRSVPVREPPALVKAATLHQVRVDAGQEGYHADVILDI